MLREFILSVIISIDIFLPAVVYSSSKIRIPFLSAFIISGFSAVVFGVSITISELLNRFISTEIFRVAGFIILTFIGLTAVLKSIFRCVVRRLTSRGELSWKPRDVGIVIKLYLDDTAVDTDCSKTLSPREALTFALATALDSAATGLSCGYTETDPVISAIFAFLTGSAAIFFGCIIGRKMTSAEKDFSWVGGAALIAFAVFEFFK